MNYSVSVYTIEVLPDDGFKALLSLANDLIMKMTRCDPMLRPTAQDILKHPLLGNHLPAIFQKYDCPNSFEKPQCLTE